MLSKAQHDKWDIFHYIYAVLHHPEYGERYAANPLSSFGPQRTRASGRQGISKALVSAGQCLAEIHSSLLATSAANCSLDSAMPVPAQ